MTARKRGVSAASSIALPYNALSDRRAKVTHRQRVDRARCAGIAHFEPVPGHREGFVTPAQEQKA